MVNYNITKVLRRFDYVESQFESLFPEFLKDKKFCTYFKSEDKLLDALVYAVCERFWVKFFSDLDDNSTEWKEIYNTIEKYLTFMYQDKVKDAYKKKCGLKESVNDDIKYTLPNFDLEWEEAKRYKNHPTPEKKINWNKKDWIEKSMKGREVKFSEIENKLENISEPSEFKQLLPEKLQRFFKSLSKKSIELPIAVKLPNGKYDLVAGNTRVTGLRNHGYDPKIWVFDL